MVWEEGIRCIDKEQQQKQPSLNPKFLGLDMDSQQTSQGRLHVLFSAILPFEVILFVISLIDVIFFFTFYIIVILVFLYLPSTWINSHFLTGASITLLWIWQNHLKRPSLIFSSIWVTPIFKQISSFWILHFLVFSRITFSFQLTLIDKEQKKKFERNMNCKITSHKE